MTHIGIVWISPQEAGEPSIMSSWAGIEEPSLDSITAFAEGGHYIPSPFHSHRAEWTSLEFSCPPSHLQLLKASQTQEMGRHAGKYEGAAWCLYYHVRLSVDGGIVSVCCQLLHYHLQDQYEYWKVSTVAPPGDRPAHYGCMWPALVPKQVKCNQ